MDFVVDFYAPKARLVIEIDGGHHGEEEQAERDRVRDEVLAQVGLSVVRFSNRQIEENLEAVVEEIRRLVAERIGG